MSQEYPNFEEVFDHVDFSFGNIIGSNFPEPLNKYFIKNNSLDYRDEITGDFNPIKEGLVVSRGRLKFNKNKYDIIGLTLVETPQNSFITPFYANANSGLGFIDSSYGVKTSISSFSEINLEDKIKEIREKENKNYFDLPDILTSVVGTYFAYSIFGGLIGIDEIIEQKIGISKESQRWLLSIGTTIYKEKDDFKKKVSKMYKELALELETELKLIY